MKKNSFTIFILIVLYGFIACTPYNSNKVNSDLLQGKWILVDVEHTAYDSIEIDYVRESTFLIFEGNKCIQYMPDLNDTLKFTFVVDDYKLELHKDSNLINRLDIMILSEDSLMLCQQENEWEYKKIKQ